MALAMDSPRIPNGNGDALWKGRDKSKFNQCECCPYGYHIDLDFVRFCDNVSQRNDASLNRERRRDRRRQRQSMEVLLGLTSQSFWNIEQQLPKIPQEPALTVDTPDGEEKSTLVRDALHKAVQDFEDTLERTHKTTVNHHHEHITDGYADIPPEAASSGDISLSSMSAVSSPVTPQDVDNDGGMSSAAHEALLQDFDVASIGSATSGHSHAALQNIRQQMALSLERMRDLEEQVKLIPVLQVHLAVAKEEKRKMSLLLQERKLENFKSIDETERVESSTTVTTFQDHKSKNDSKNVEKSGHDRTPHNKITRPVAVHPDSADAVYLNKYSEQSLDTRDIPPTSLAIAPGYSRKEANTTYNSAYAKCTTPEHVLTKNTMVISMPVVATLKVDDKNVVNSGTQGSFTWDFSRKECASASEVRKQRHGSTRPRSRSVSEGSRIGELHATPHNFTLPARKEKTKRDVQVQAVRHLSHASTQSGSYTESKTIPMRCISTQTSSDASTKNNSIIEPATIPMHCDNIIQNPSEVPVMMKQPHLPVEDKLFNDSITFKNSLESTLTLSVQAFDTYFNDSSKLMSKTDKQSHLNMFKDTLQKIMNQPGTTVESVFSSVTSSGSSLIRDDIEVPLKAVSLKSLDEPRAPLDSVTKPVPPPPQRKDNITIYSLKPVQPFTMLDMPIPHPICDKKHIDDNKQASVDVGIDCNILDFRCANCNLHLDKKDSNTKPMSNNQSNLPDWKENKSNVKRNYNKTVCTQTRVLSPSKNVSTNTLKMKMVDRRVGDSVPIPTQTCETCGSLTSGEFLTTRVKEEKEKRSSSHDRESRIPRPSPTAGSPTYNTKKFVRQTTYTKLDVPEVADSECTSDRSWTLPTSSVTTSVYPTSKDESSDEYKKSLPSAEGSQQWISGTDTSLSTGNPPSVVSSTHRAPLAPHQSQENPVHKSSSLSLKSIVPHGSLEIQNDGVSVISQTSYSTDSQTSQAVKPYGSPHMSNKRSSMTHSAPPLSSFLDRSETRPRTVASGSLTVGHQPEIESSSAVSRSVYSPTLYNATHKTNIGDTTFSPLEYPDSSHGKPGDASGTISRARTDTSKEATTHREHHPQSPKLASSPILNVNIKREIEPLDDARSKTGRSKSTKPVMSPVLNKTSSPDQLYSWENTYSTADPNPGKSQQSPNTDVGTVRSRQVKPALASPTTPDVNKLSSPDQPYSWEYAYTLAESNSSTGRQKPNTDASSSTCSEGVKEEMLTLTASERPKRVDPSTKMRAALKVVNDLIEKSSTISDLGNTAKAANGIIQREWFQISSTPSADPHIVEDYLDHFEEMSSTLLTYVVNMADKAGNTAMHYALSQGNFDVVSILLDSKVCNINLPNAAGYTAVMLVSLAQIRSDTHRCVLQRFLADADVNVRAQQHGQTALMLAVSHNRLDMVQLLIEGGADLNIQDDDGSTALMCAAEHGHAAIVQFLINQPDTDLNIKDVDGLTALDIALDAGHKDVGILLYAHKHFSRNNSPYSSLRGRRSKSATPTTRTASTPPPRTPSSPLPVRAPPRHSHD